MEVPIPTTEEPTGPPDQSNSSKNLRGRLRGWTLRFTRFRLSRRLAQRLLETAGDELVRTAVKASTTGLGLAALYWIQHR